jgi:hypothetical protein
MTAVEWLIKDLISKGLLTLSGDTLKSIGNAKEMEEEQKIEFACAVYDKYNFGPQDISFREECVQFKSE